MSYYEKYLKYKTKYINYKTQLSNTKLNNTKLSNIEELGESDEELNDLSKLSLTGGSSKIRNLSKLTNNKSTKLQTIEEISSLTETPTNNQSEKYIKTFKQTGGNSKSKAIQSINNLTETPTMKELYGYEYKDYSKLTNLLNNEQDAGGGKRGRGQNYIADPSGKLVEDLAQNEKDEDEEEYLDAAAKRAKANFDSNKAPIIALAQAQAQADDEQSQAQAEDEQYYNYLRDPANKQYNLGNNAANTNADPLEDGYNGYDENARDNYEAKVEADTLEDGYDGYDENAINDYKADALKDEYDGYDENARVDYKADALKDEYNDNDQDDEEKYYTDSHDVHVEKLSSLIENMDMTGGGKKSKRNNYFFKNADLSDTSENNLYLIDS
jgi:hypothetical protein